MLFREGTHRAGSPCVFGPVFCFAGFIQSKRYAACADKSRIISQYRMIQWMTLNENKGEKMVYEDLRGT